MTNLRTLWDEANEKIADALAEDFREAFYERLDEIGIDTASYVEEDFDYYYLEETVLDQAMLDIDNAIDDAIRKVQSGATRSAERSANEILEAEGEAK